MLWYLLPTNVNFKRASYILSSILMSGLCAEQKMLMVRQSPLIISSGFLLCFHYGAWVESIETTSLAHAVLAVSTSPIFLAIGAWILRKPISYGNALSAVYFHFWASAATHLCTSYQHYCRSLKCDSYVQNPSQLKDHVPTREILRTLCFAQQFCEGTYSRFNLKFWLLSSCVPQFPTQTWSHTSFKCDKWASTC